ncbi:MAG: hypothetical protein EBZ77_05220 [Chitinophagia bacterium]|nr:hypothetical protein [Chitinophagia bacterium]
MSYEKQLSPYCRLHHLCVKCFPCLSYKTAFENAVAELKLSTADKHKNAASEHELKYKVRSNDTSMKGYILTSTTSGDKKSGDILIFDLKGNVLYQKHLPAAIYDFRQWKLSGKTYYSYLVADSTVVNSRKTVHFVPSGYLVLADSAMNEVSKFRFVDEKNEVSYGNPGVDIHDIIFFTAKHYISFSRYEKVVNNIPASLHPAKDKKVLALIVQEIDNGKVKWQWDATDFPEFYESSTEDNNFTNDSLCDYIHNNTITLDARDSNLILSMRNLHQIVKIDRHNGKIIWRLGGRNSDFPLDHFQHFYHQHAVKFMDDGQTLQFVDNGSEEERPYSRIVELRLDEVKKKIAYYKQYTSSK